VPILEPSDRVVRTVVVADAPPVKDTFAVVVVDTVREREVGLDANVTDDDVERDDGPVVDAGFGATVTKNPVPLMF